MTIVAFPVLYDAGALLAADRDDRRMRSLHQAALSDKRHIIVPAPVLTQVWRDGAKQARISRILKGCVIEPTAEHIAKRAGVLLGRTSTSDAVDAIVVATAFSVGASIVTSDANDISALIQACDFPCRIELIRI